jgi:hypothetical protein
MNHTHEREQMQDPSSAGASDQLNENGSISFRLSLDRVRQESIQWLTLTNKVSVSDAGLGDATIATRVTIHWLSGTTRKGAVGVERGS